MEDAGFDKGVVFVGFVPAQVVGSEVEPEGDMGMEGIDSFELVTGDFDDKSMITGIDNGDEGESDVSGGEGFDSGVVQDMSDKGGGGAFTVSSSDGDDAAFAKTGGEFQFADDGDLGLTRLEQEGVIEGHSGGDN